MTNQHDGVRLSNSGCCNSSILQCDTTLNQSYRLALCRSCVLRSAPLWSRLHRTFAKLGGRPTVFVSANQLPHLKVFLTVSVEILPFLDLLLYFLPCLPSFPLCSCLPLSTTDDLLLVVYWNIYEFCAPHIVCSVFQETASHESTCCIPTCEDAVTATRAVGMAASGDVENGAVDRKVYRQVWVRTVVGG
jgi:hypothetical protein